MSYNKQYNTRHSGRYNTPGHFVSAGEAVPGIGRHQTAAAKQQQNAQMAQSQPQSQFNVPRKAPQNNVNQGIVNQNQNLQTIQTMDVEMKAKDELLASGGISDTASNASGGSRPFWMKSKLDGVKKVSNRERRRRQNENLRRLLTPKNALMVLHEILPKEQLGGQFTVEPATSQQNNQYYTSKQQHSFCADLNIRGHVYKGYGENKLTARNVAAEQAIRDLIIERMNKVLGPDGAGGEAGAEGGAAGEGGEEEALPMIQLASFALHKLFAEWEYEGHKVPQLKPQPTPSVSECAEGAGAGVGAGAGGGGGGGKGAGKGAGKAKEVPVNAGNMHPCMLLTYMRPHLEYRELAVDGDKPQNLLFTLGIDVDGSTYIGKASNKKEARKQAAKAACEQLFGVHFNEFATDSTPQHAPA